MPTKPTAPPVRPRVPLPPRQDTGNTTAANCQRSIAVILLVSCIIASVPHVGGFIWFIATPLDFVIFILLIVMLIQGAVFRAIYMALLTVLAAGYIFIAPLVVGPRVLTLYQQITGKRL
jgi:hypothetical protein